MTFVIPYQILTFEEHISFRFLFCIMNGTNRTRMDAAGTRSGQEKGQSPRTNRTDSNVRPFLRGIREANPQDIYAFARKAVSSDAREGVVIMEKGDLGIE